MIEFHIRLAKPNEVPRSVVMRVASPRKTVAMIHEAFACQVSVSSLPVLEPILGNTPIDAVAHSLAFLSALVDGHLKIEGSSVSWD